MGREQNLSKLGTLGFYSSFWQNQKKTGRSMSSYPGDRDPLAEIVLYTEYGVQILSL